MNANDYARERCEKLLEMARKAWLEGEHLFARRYVRLARKIAMRHRFPLGARRFCKKCDAPFIGGKTLRVRLKSREKTVLYICVQCGSESKLGYSRPKRVSSRPAAKAKKGAGGGGVPGGKPHAQGKPA